MVTPEPGAAETAMSSGMAAVPGCRCTVNLYRLLGSLLAGMR